jgi:choline dehydrogenase-like flavoprotein
VLVDFKNSSETAAFQGDICIVGAGAAGITLAKELIPTGKQIILVEGGDLTYSEESQSLYRIARDSPYFDPARSRLRYFGGSTNHWEGSCRPFDRIDFERRSWVQNSGWPYSYDDLAPYYERAFVYLDLAGHPGESPRIETLGPYAGRLTDAGFGVRLGYASPPTRFGKKYLEDLRSAPNVKVLINANLMEIHEAGNRRSAESLTISNFRGKTASISAGIYILALGGIENPRALLLSDAVTPGGIGNEFDLVGRYFMDHPVVEAVVFYPEPGLKQALGNGIVATPSGETHALYLQANEDVLRRNQLTNARMPLEPATKTYVSLGIESTHQIEKAVTRGKALHEILTHLGHIIGESDLVIEQWRRQHGFSPANLRGDAFGGYAIPMMLEQCPDKDNRVFLTEERDALGLRKGRISWRLPQTERDNLKRLIELFAKGTGMQGLGLVRSMLAVDDTDRRFEELMNFGHHHMGTTRASADPKTGVVDANQRVHGRENLYVAGSSVFPTGGNVPPTTTIVATTIRLADHLKTRLS